MHKIIIFIYIIFLLSSCSAQTKQENVEITTQFNENNFPRPIGYVNDYISILESSEVKSLEYKLQTFKEQTTNEIVIVTLDLDGLTEENFDEYTLGLSRF